MKWCSVKCCASMWWSDGVVHLCYEVMVSEVCTSMLWSDDWWSVVHLCYEVMVSEVLYIYVMKWWSVKCCIYLWIMKLMKWWSVKFCTSMLWSDGQWSVVHLRMMVVKFCTSMLWSDGQWGVVHLCYEVMVSEVLYIWWCEVYIYVMKWQSVKCCTSMLCCDSDGSEVLYI